LRKALDMLNRVSEYMVIALYTVMISLMTVQVILRKFFSAPLPWAEEASRILFVWMVFIGAALATYARRHIVVDFFVGYLPEKVRNWVDKLVLPTGGIVLLVVVYYGWLLTMETWHRKAFTLPWLSQGLAFYLPVTIGSALMLINMARSRLEPQPSEQENPADKGV